MRLVGIRTAETRPRLVDRALPLPGVEERAHLAERFVLLMAQGAHLLIAVVLGEAVLRLPVGDFKMLREARDVALADLDQVVATAITGAFRAVVVDAGFGGGCGLLDDGDDAVRFGHEWWKKQARA